MSDDFQEYVKRKTLGILTNPRVMDILVRHSFPMLNPSYKDKEIYRKEIIEVAQKIIEEFEVKE